MLKINLLKQQIYMKQLLDLNPEYTHFDNAALSYYRDDYFEQAEKLFRYTLRNFEDGNGKSEFYFGLFI